jgi:hypothetical protein
MIVLLCQLIMKTLVKNNIKYDEDRNKENKDRKDYDPAFHIVKEYYDLYKKSTDGIA